MPADPTRPPAPLDPALRGSHPEPVDPSRPPALRASDAERDRIIDVLRAAVTDGRLEPVEFDERVDAALAARTVEALAPLVADLVPRPGAGLTTALPYSTEPAAELLTIKESHGTVRREGRWTLPHRLLLRTSWSDVHLDLSEAVCTVPELVVELKVSGGRVELILAPGMIVDVNELSARHSHVTISRDAGGGALPETLRVRLVGRLRHGHLETRWQTPRR
ncbi:DUF1707 domain-containing protein [Nonomuraea sp. NPDC050328]|uniref:DUF1707 domain-containing protein n=1 Tax=Nonomuraea sp. NPDC050328 TaxID=3364361 RepID=UPI0037A85AFE